MWLCCPQTQPGLLEVSMPSPALSISDHPPCDRSIKHAQPRPSVKKRRTRQQHDCGYIHLTFEGEGAAAGAGGAHFGHIAQVLDEWCSNNILVISSIYYSWNTEHTNQCRITENQTQLTNFFMHAIKRMRTVSRHQQLLSSNICTAGANVCSRWCASETLAAPQAACRCQRQVQLLPAIICLTLLLGREPRVRLRRLTLKLSPINWFALGCTRRPSSLQQWAAVTPSLAGLFSATRSES